MKLDKRKKEQQNFLDELNIIDLEIVNGIVYDKIQEAKSEERIVAYEDGVKVGMQTMADALDLEDEELDYSEDWAWERENVVKPQNHLRAKQRKIRDKLLKDNLHETR